MALISNTGICYDAADVWFARHGARCSGVLRSSRIPEPQHPGHPRADERMVLVLQARAADFIIIEWN